MLTAFLLGVAVMCAVAAVLTLLILVADATIGRYGTVDIVVNDGEPFAIEGGVSLLSALKERGLFVPSACGGRGSCGLCKLTVQGGGGSVLPTETAWLSRQEIAEGVRLACQIKVRQPLRVFVPEELFNVHRFETEVAAMRDLTHDIKEVVLRLLQPPAMHFRAGQYIQIEVPPYELTDEPVYRAYSISSPPSIEDRVELEIRLVPHGICTTYVHRRLKVGDRLNINGPYGDFTLRETNRDILFVAGGSGMAPIKSILYDMAERGVSRRTRYFFGARTAGDLFLMEEMKALERRLPDFRFIPALSAPEPGTWDGETGLVTEVMSRQVKSVANTEAYLCGSPGLIDACIVILKRMGMPEDLIYYDKFA